MREGISPLDGLSGPFGSRGVSFTVSITGLTDGEARPGATLGYTAPDDVTIASQAWETSLGGGSGTGTTFLVPAEANGGTVTLLLTTNEGDTRSLTRNVYTENLILDANGTPLADADGELLEVA